MIIGDENSINKMKRSFARAAKSLSKTSYGVLRHKLAKITVNRIQIAIKFFLNEQVDLLS